MNKSAPTSAQPPRERKWIVRPYREGDEVQAVELFNRIFDKHITPAQYLWKVIRTPWPVGIAPTWFADADGLIVGQYASTPMRFRVHGEEIPIVHVCDVMTHPDFRRQGILSVVGEAAHRAWAEQGVAFVTGFPHKGWGSRSAYLNWETMHYADWMWKPLRLDQVLRDKIPLPSFLAAPVRMLGIIGNALRDTLLELDTSAIEVTEVTTPGEEFDRLWQRLRQAYEAMVVRDRAWVQYRYAGAPEMGYGLLLARRDGQPAGYLAYRLRRLPSGTVGYIADLFTAPFDLLSRLALIDHALTLFYRAGAKAALTVVGRQSALAAVFRRAGFIRRFQPFNVSIVPLQEGLPRQVLSDPNRWFAMGGDFDMV